MFGFYSLFGIKRKIEREKIGKHLHAKKPIQTLDLFFDIKLLLILILITKIENIGLENPEIISVFQSLGNNMQNSRKPQLKPRKSRSFCNVSNCKQNSNTEFAET